VRNNLKIGSDPLIKKSLSLLIILFYSISTSVFAVVEKDTVSATLTVMVTTTVNEKLGNGIPIQNARIVVIDSMGEIEGTALTNTKGKAQIPVTTLKDPRFPLKNMGEVTVLAFADGYNEHINFSVPINEYHDQTARVSISLWEIDPHRRNEPQFINGSFHRFTVFEMLNYYAGKLGLSRQKVQDPSIDPAPWGPGV
jgi:hypothetical protein